MSQKQLPWELCHRRVDWVKEKTVCSESEDPSSICTEKEDLLPLKVSINSEDGMQHMSMRKDQRRKIRPCRGTLSRLTQRFMILLRSSPGGVLDLNKTAEILGVQKRRLYDVTNVLSGIKLVKRKSRSHIQWIGPDLSNLEVLPQQKKLEEELFDLSVKETALDELIKDCAQQLFELVEDGENKSLAYVSYQDIQSIEAFHEQIIFAVRTPEKTSLHVLPPTEDSIAVHIKSTKGPIDVYVCEMAQNLSSNETSDGAGTSSSESTHLEHPHPEKEEAPPEQSEELLEVKTNGM